MGRRLITHGNEETRCVGCDFGQTLRCGDVVVFYGDLGVGKTAFIGGIVAGFFGPGSEGDIVTSPSFGGFNLYESGVLRVYHYDLYRFSSSMVVPEIFDDVEPEKGLVCIEWGERLSADFQKTASIRMTYGNKFNEREIVIDDSRTFFPS